MKRYALCIGNDEYQILSKLSCAVADAKAIAEKLECLGFDVDTALNLERDELNSKIVSLSNKANEYDAVLLYLDEPNSVYNMSPSDFEDMVAEIFQRKGFNVKITPRTRDGGKDIIASYNMGGIPCMIIIECKRYAPDRKVGVSVVRALHGTQMKEHYGKAVVVTSSSFSRDARKFANDLRDMVILVDFEELMEMLNDTLMT